MAITRSIRQGIGTVWRGVLSAVSSGRDLFSFTTGLKRAYQVQGIPESQVQANVIDYFGQLAGQWDTAQRNVAGAGPSEAVDSSMIALAPWSMPLDEFNTRPGYHIVLGIKVEGQEQLVYRTITGVTTLPATVGELRNLAYSNAVAMSAATTAQGGVGGTVLATPEITVTVGPSGAAL